MVNIHEKYTVPESVCLDPQAEGTFFGILRRLVEFRIGKTETQEALQQLIGEGVYNERGAILYAYISYNESPGTREAEFEEGKRERAERLLGMALEQSREQSGLTIQEVAQRAGIRTSEAMALEKGDTTVLPNLAAVLNIGSLRQTLPDKLQALIKAEEM